MWIVSYTCCLFSGCALTFIAAPRLLAIVTNAHIVHSLGSKETHIQSHNRFCSLRAPWAGVVNRAKVTIGAYMWA